MAKRKPNSRHHGRRHEWESFGDEDLLQLRFRELGLRMADSVVHNDVERLYGELARRGIRFRPHVWLSTDWFSPDGVPGIAVPYFVAHPRLRRLERRLTGEVEGGNAKWRMRILRHEAGHALDTAYGLRRRADWRRVFGPASKPYPQAYSVRPGSHRYVLHLGHWYAQSHPTEDFAETFAVWLQPKARWRREYAGWPALQKLEYVDALMAEIAGRAARNRDRSVIVPLSGNSRTLGEHYRRKRSTEDPNERRYDARLKRVFPARSTAPAHPPVARFIRENGPRMKRTLIGTTGVSSYLAEHVVEAITQRARDLELVLRDDSRRSERQALELLVHVATDVLRRNREKYVL